MSRDENLQARDNDEAIYWNKTILIDKFNKKNP